MAERLAVIGETVVRPINFVVWEGRQHPSPIVATYKEAAIDHLNGSFKQRTISAFAYGFVGDDMRCNR